MPDLSAHAFTRHGSTLSPSDQFAEEALRELPEGKEVHVTWRRVRNVSHHRFFFAMLRKVCEATGKWNDEEDLLDAIKLATGHTHKIMTLNGEMLVLPKSISFANMDESAFTRFKERAMYVIAEATGIDPVTLMEEVE